MHFPSQETSTLEKVPSTEDFVEHTVHDAAERGHVATDRYGHSLVHFDPKAEAKLRRKIDFCVVPIVSFIYLFAFIDRANIGNARLAGLEKDLGLAGYDYNMILSMFYISYILFEIPVTMFCKLIGPGWFLPGTTLAFGIVSIGTAFTNNRASTCAVRFILGIFEAGMLPGITYYLSRWYRRQELTFRIGLFITMAPLAGAFGGLLASAILTLPNFGSLQTWRMIFGIEGIITCTLGLLSLIFLTDRPETARWLSPAEKDLAIARVKSERPHVTEVLDGFDLPKILRGIFNPVVFTSSILFLLTNIPVQGLAFFAPTIIKTIYPTETVVFQQLHTVPPYVVGAVFVVLWPYLSFKFNRIVFWMLLSGPILITGYTIFLATTNGTARYVATFLIASGSFSFGPLCTGLTAVSTVSDTSRSSAIGLTVMFGNLGGLISTWSFLPFDGPNYPIGNGLNVATAATAWITAMGLLFWMRSDNKKRDAKGADTDVSGLTQKEIEDLDWKSAAFRWKL